MPGAFTDARDRKGKFEYADGGTLFLDEVGDMPVPTQIKLLRVLESGEITRVGSNETVKVNVRILSATNRNLEEAIARGDVSRGPVSPAEGDQPETPQPGGADAGHSALDRSLHEAFMPPAMAKRSRA